MLKWKSAAVLGAAAASLVLGASLPALASAQTTVTNAASQTQSHTHKSGAFWQHRLGLLSKIIGTSETQLEQDVKQGMTFDAVLKQAGLTPQTFRQRLNAAGAYEKGMKRQNTLRLRELAKDLRLTPAQLKADFAKHETLAEIAKAQGVDMTILKQDLRRQRRALGVYRLVVRETAKALNVSPKTLAAALKNHGGPALLQKQGLTLAQLETRVVTSVNTKIKNQNRQKTVDARIVKILNKLFG